MKREKLIPGLRRGLSLIEFMLALTITAMVGAAITAMLGAVSTGVATREDGRAVMVQSNAAQSRLSAYIAPSRCALEVDGANMVLWRDDSRASGTVHATEIRWLTFDAALGTIDVSFVSFPDDWTQAAKDLEDGEYAATSNWETVLSEYVAKGLIASYTLVDGLKTIEILTDQLTDQDSRHFVFDLEFQADSTVSATSVAATIRLHKKPTA